VPDPCLTAEGLRARLGKKEILGGVSFELAPGEVLGVLGPSGAGKSTLFRVLVGELTPSEGKVTILGHDVTKEPLWRRARRGLGYVPQTPSVLFDLSVADNIRTFVRVTRVDTRDVEAIAEDVALGSRLHVKAKELSGGERRRLELLRALIAKPKVLVCDEPFTGIDPAATHRVGRLLVERAREGMAIVVADHRITEALEHCDRAVLLVDGRLELETSPEEFTSHPAVRRRYLG
jgi:lipopolysaccharide export system ATP-binding protein